MRPLLALLVFALLSFVSMACGSGNENTVSTSRSSADVATTSGAPATTTPSGTTSSGTSAGANAKTSEGPANDASDGDFLDAQDKGDDVEITQYGHRAGAKDEQAVKGFTTRYFAAAGAANGGALCALLPPASARSIATEFGKAGETYLRGKTCAEVMSKLLQHNHRQLAIEASKFKVTSVRVNGNNAFALLAFTTMPERRYISVQREGPTWKMSSEYIDGPYP